MHFFEDDNEEQIDWKNEEQVKKAIENGIDWDTTSFKEHLDKTYEQSKPFSKSRRPIEFRNVLLHYGLDESECPPHPCFENKFKKIFAKFKKRKNAEDFCIIEWPSVSEIASDIKSDENYRYLVQKVDSRSGISDSELVKRCYSSEGCEGYYWSFCRSGLEDTVAYQP